MFTGIVREVGLVVAMEGGPEGRTLFLLSSTDAYPERLAGTKLSRLDATTVDVPAAGWG